MMQPTLSFLVIFYYFNFFLFWVVVTVSFRAHVNIGSSQPSDRGQLKNRTDTEKRLATQLSRIPYVEHCTQVRTRLRWTHLIEHCTQVRTRLRWTHLIESDVSRTQTLTDGGAFLAGTFSPTTPYHVTVVISNCHPSSSINQSSSSSSSSSCMHACIIITMHQISSSGLCKRKCKCRFI